MTDEQYTPQRRSLCERLLDRVVIEHRREEVVGDLLELRLSCIEQFGPWRGRLQFCFELLRLTPWLLCGDVDPLDSVELLCRVGLKRSGVWYGIGAALASTGYPLNSVRVLVRDRSAAQGRYLAVYTREVPAGLVPPQCIVGFYDVDPREAAKKAICAVADVELPVLDGYAFTIKTTEPYREGPGRFRCRVVCAEINAGLIVPKSSAKGESVWVSRDALDTALVDDPIIRKYL